MDEDQWTQVQQKFRQIREQVALRQREQQQYRRHIEQLRVEQQQRDTGAMYALPPKRIPSGKLQESINKVDSLARLAERQETKDPHELRRQQAWLASKQRLQQQIMQQDRATGGIQRRLSYLLATTQVIEERQTERIPTVRRTTTQPLYQDHSA